LQALSVENIVDEVDSDEDSELDYSKLMPTLAHQSITRLYELDKMHGVFTQNCDNLHSKANTPRLITSDLHGNVFIEYCEKCFREYERDYAVDQFSTDCHAEKWYVKCATCGWNHYTGILCAV
jgi:NAD-dependent SIR2 family protein deacetylase